MEYRAGPSPLCTDSLAPLSSGAFPECSLSDLVSLHCGRYGTSGPAFLMTRDTAAGWTDMQHSAREAGLHLAVSSAFRSIKEQHTMIERLLERGLREEEVFRWFRPPGFSEHHTGRALDISFGDISGYPTIARYEESPAFEWLCKNACRFGFSLSYPRENSAGIAYEPWHWLHQGTPFQESIAQFARNKETEQLQRN